MTLAEALFMVEPACFGFNPEAARSNRFATDPGGGEDLPGAARAEMCALARALRSAGIEVVVGADDPHPPRPDAVFPNNWFSTHPDGRLVLYPMAPRSRRAERRPELVDRIRAFAGSREVVDLTGLEDEGEALEGTGSLVFDHERRRAFVAWSPRATPRAVEAFSRALGYEIVGFRAELDGVAVYHTNVVLALGPGVALLAEELVTEGGAGLAEALADRRLVRLDARQVRSFAGNMLAVATPAGPRWIASDGAWRALRPDQQEALGACVLAGLPTIERVGGGSARCMVAELYRAAGRPRQEHRPVTKASPSPVADPCTEARGSSPP